MYNTSVDRLDTNKTKYYYGTCEENFKERQQPLLEIKVLSGIKVRVFFEKNVEKKPLCRHDKNYYYFCKSNIPVINLIAGSTNMIKVSKNMSFEKIKLTMRVVFRR